MLIEWGAVTLQDDFGPRKSFFHFSMMFLFLNLDFWLASSFLWDIIAFENNHFEKKKHVL